jgi:hypothetical protein
MGSNMSKAPFTIPNVIYVSFLVFCGFILSCNKDDDTPSDAQYIVEKVIFQPYFNGNPDVNTFVTQFTYTGQEVGFIKQFSVKRANNSDTVVLNEIIVEYPSAELILLKFACNNPGSSNDQLLSQELLLDNDRRIVKSSVRYRRFPIGLYQEFREYLYNSSGDLKQSVARNNLIPENQSDGFKDMAYLNNTLTSCKTFPNDTAGIPYFSSNDLTYQLSYYSNGEMSTQPLMAGIINSLSMPFHCLDISVRFGFQNIYLHKGQTSSLVKELKVDGTTSSPLIENTTSTYVYEKDSRGRVSKLKCYLTDPPRGKSNELSFEMAFIYK